MNVEEVAELLGVKPSTIYAYVSRGQLDSVRDPSDPRRRLYRRADIERLKARSDARAGHGPVAAGALRWGPPVIETAVSTIDYRGPIYRGHAATGLVGQGFERTAELLWTGRLPDHTPRWSPQRPISVATSAAPLLTLSRSLLERGAEIDGDDDVLDAARALLVDAATSGAARASAAPIASRLAAAWERPELADIIDTALVLVAEHELNASTFATRVVASTGAPLHAALSAGVAALSGPRHGAVITTIERLLDDLADERGARALVRRALREGRTLPALAHPLYPSGDPRARQLLHQLRVHFAEHPRLPVIEALLDEAQTQGMGRPSVDLTLAALAHLSRLPPGRGIAVFAIGRIAGWVAHYLEQRSQGFLLRPRAEYTERQ